MSENDSITQSQASPAESRPNAAALTLHNHSSVNPTLLQTQPPLADGPDASPSPKRPDALLVRRAEFVERIETRIDPIGTQRRRMAQSAITRKHWKPIRLNGLRHARKCRICNHPRREEIESDYLAWLSPAHLAFYYHLRSDASVYRHARALGLDKKRRHNLRGALEAILQKAHSATITAAGVVSAARAYASLDDRGRWTEPTHRTIVTHINSTPSEQPQSKPSQRKRRFASRPSRRSGKRASQKNSDRKMRISNRLVNRQIRSKSK